MPEDSDFDMCTNWKDFLDPQEEGLQILILGVFPREGIVKIPRKAISVEIT